MQVNDCRRVATDPLQLSCDVTMPGRPCGRLTEGLSLGPAREPALATMYRLESASAIAFERLARELSALGAPQDLIAGASAAVRDERRHARLVEALLGAPPEGLAALSFESLAPRGVLEIALENAVEGCVRETWGALSARHQAEHAPSPELRALFASLADDELAHAEWSARLHAWALSQLDEGDRARVRRARLDAIDSLLAALAAPGCPRELGEPPLSIAQPAASVLFRELTV